MRKRHDKIVRKLHVAAERCRDAESHRFRWERQARGYVAAARLIQHVRRARLLPAGHPIDSLVERLHAELAKADGF
jgi:hypothetical protein